MAYLKFNDLPEKIQERLLKRLSGEGEGVAFKARGNFLAFIFAAAAIVWFGLLFFLANDYLWSKPKIIIFGLISLVAAYFLVQNLLELIRWSTSRSKCFFLVTPLYAIEINYNDVRYWNLEQLAAVNSNHLYQNGVYKFTEIKITFEDITKTFKIKNLETAEETVEKISYLRKRFIESTARNDETYLNSNNDFIELESQYGESQKTAQSSILKLAAIFASAAILTVGVMYAAVFLNNYYDDKKSWEAAESVNRASSFRSYLQTHRYGRWSADANQKLQTFYDAAGRKYQSSLNKGYDPQAAEAILKILEYAKTTHNFRVQTVFERRNEIPPDIVETLKKEYEVNKILSLDDTFSDEKMKRREDLILTFIADAFRQIIHDDILEISGDCSVDCVTFLVKYTVDSDSIYYDEREKELPEAERTYNPGIFINWDFGIKIPNQSENYSFTLTSTPAEHFSYDSNFNAETEAGKNIIDVLNVEKSNVYDAMAASAFDDFKQNLIFRMGIGESPKSAAEDEINTEKNSPATKVKPKQKK